MRQGVVSRKLHRHTTQIEILFFCRANSKLQGNIFFFPYSVQVIFLF